NRLLHDSSEAVVREAIATCGTVGYVEAAPQLMEKLGDKHLRRESREALLKLGSRVIPELVRRLSNPEQDDIIRKRIPKKLALARSHESTDALTGSLHKLDYHLDYALIKAFNWVRVHSPKIIIDAECILKAIARERGESDKLRVVQGWLQTNPIDDATFPLL